MRLRIATLRREHLPALIVALGLGWCAFDVAYRAWDNYQLFRLQQQNYQAELKHIGNWEPEYQFPAVKLGNRLSY